MKSLLRDLVALRAEMLALEADVLAAFPRVHRSYVRSACNLAHYTALRASELRRTQQRLAKLGLSSLGRAEGNVLANVEAVIRLVAAAARVAPPARPRSRGRVPLLGGRRILEDHAASLLGPRPRERDERILVTLPSEAADDPGLARGLVDAGMDCARVNCAHDDARGWTRMIRNVRDAARARRRKVRLFMDLAGPKLRTGPIARGPEVVHWRPRRDDLGRVVSPARVWLHPEGGSATPPEPAVSLPVAADWLARRRSGDVVSFVDARGSLRTLRIDGSVGACRWAFANQSTYVVSGTRLEAAARAGDGREEASAEARSDAGCVGRLAGIEQWIVLAPGDEIVLTTDLAPGAPAQRDAGGRAVQPARIGCTLPEAVAAARPGHAVWFDDGRMGGVVVESSKDACRVRIDHAPADGARLRADKGINLPDTDIRTPALTPKDVEDLSFVVRHADAVGLSFVRSRADVDDILDRVAALGRPDFGVVLKIETRQAFENLPALLLAAMRSPAAGVMIARGDLAVECGWERLAELQEEILWFCEAAHVPVVWATQVLDGMARTGIPTRAEVTDAAMASRAECVMLNKGPHVLDAVAALDGILRRMQGHQRKKSPLLRRLHVATRFVTDRAACRARGAPRRAAHAH